MFAAKSVELMEQPLLRLSFPPTEIYTTSHFALHSFTFLESYFAHSAAVVPEMAALHTLDPMHTPSRKASPMYAPILSPTIRMLVVAVESWRSSAESVIAERKDAGIVESFIFLWFAQCYRLEF